ncbi:flagellar basal body L-ring protein FlgH [Rhodoferax sp. TBRC 17199]|uniref:Flagellar L-ring protein n=2 Tax=Rhodoferax mekongensis TaxID=3068341 RepID=A0ABZ0B1X1_9BURK|nr:MULTISPECIES: flagellar basal body L-ring protein FlgH [unclassified Rhodoferax]MDT7514256.1 flagellar basal body L-ring protein FlgH [Rhodoferax sp. TBRC 17199]WNO04922.1 flagellar basal body L-ring protein FlgH [Rhodoferax sp. TBRC 17307]
MLPPIFTRVASAAAMVVLAAGCQQMPQKVTVDFVEPRVPAAPIASVVSKPANGSIYQQAAFRPAFEDRRARLVGDAVTIQIVENVTASQKSTSTVNRNTSIDSAITALPDQTLAGLGKLNVGASTNNNFSGKGGTESANTFSGSITATVIETLPNGHLVVTGEKQIGVNQNVDVLRFSGTIDPRMLQPGSVISSTQVANVRVESRGRGAQGEAQTVGWLSRFFLSFQPF